MKNNEIFVMVIKAPNLDYLLFGVELFLPMLLYTAAMARTLTTHT